MTTKCRLLWLIQHTEPAGLIRKCQFLKIAGVSLGLQGLYKNPVQLCGPHLWLCISIPSKTDLLDSRKCENITELRTRNPMQIFLCTSVIIFLLICIYCLPSHFYSLCWTCVLYFCKLNLICTNKALFSYFSKMDYKKRSKFQSEDILLGQAPF